MKTPKMLLVLCNSEMWAHCRCQLKTLIYAVYIDLLFLLHPSHSTENSASWLRLRSELSFQLPGPYFSLIPGIYLPVKQGTQGREELCFVNMRSVVLLVDLLLLGTCSSV